MRDLNLIAIALHEHSRKVNENVAVVPCAANDSLLEYLDQYHMRRARAGANEDQTVTDTGELVDRCPNLGLVGRCVKPAGHYVPGISGSLSNYSNPGRCVCG